MIRTTKLITVEQYHAMGDSGALGPEDRVELLEGVLEARPLITPAHRRSVIRTSEALRRSIPAGWHVATQQPITTDDSEPEPDVTVIRGSTDDYPDRHPGLGDVGLVVEVAQTSLVVDTTTKKRIYARSGFPVYWVVNLEDSVVTTYRDPAVIGGEPDYLHRGDHRPGSELPLLLDGTEVARVAVRDLLP